MNDGIKLRTSVLSDISDLLKQAKKYDQANNDLITEAMLRAIKETIDQYLSTAKPNKPENTVE